MKKRSGASSNSKPLKPLVFFIDRSLGKKVVAAELRHIGVEVRVHDDHFPSDTKDEIWLHEVGKKGWVVLTKDRYIRYRTPELNALMEAGVQAFVLRAGDLQGKEMAEIFIKALLAMRRFVMRNPRPFIATVTKGGMVKRLMGGMP